MPTEYELLQAICRQSFASFAKKAFNIIEPGTVFEWSWHLDCISEHLQAQFNSDDEVRKLIINIPPRCLKSVLVAQLYPAWVLGNAPSHQFIGASYAHTLAERNVIKCRQILKSDWYMDTFQNTTIVQSQQDYFTTTQGGQYKGSGIGGTITGFGCFAGDTEIITDKGIMPISSIKLGINCTKALSYNHSSAIFEWKEIQASRTITSKDIYEIRTSSGRKINCTGNHPLYTNRGYVRADSLCEGDKLVEAYFLDNSKVQGVCDNIPEESSGVCEESKEWRNGYLLQPPVSMQNTKRSKDSSPKTLYGMWQRIKEFKSKVLFIEVLREFYKNLTRYKLSILCQSIQADFALNSNMLQSMCGENTFTTHERQEQPKIQRWKFLQCGLSKHEAKSIKPRQSQLRSVREAAEDNYNVHKPNQNKFSSASHRRECAEQCDAESSNFMQQLSYYASQEDTVALVKRIHSQTIPVYDLQIADNNNFFANGILAHNCSTLVIDDPISPKEAGSDTIRLTAISEIRSTLFSRFNKFADGKLIMIMQRLHEQDPTGDLLADGGYYHLKLPAENKGKTINYSRGSKTWTMEAGDLLTPRLKRADLNELCLNLTEYNYVGQYLQDPVPLGGGEFKEAWLQVYHQGSIKPKEMNVVILVDQAGGEELNKRKKKLSDWTVYAVVGLAADNNYYLLDMIRDRLNPTERVDTMFMLHRKWNALCGKPPKVGVEQIGMMTDAHYIREKQRQDAYHFSVTELGGTQIKEERIRWLIPIMQQHRFYIPPTLAYVDSQDRKFDLIAEMKGEMASFPKARWDDILDTLSRLGNADLSLQFPKVKANMTQRALQRPEQPDSWENW
jgi:phage terminase large subunit-like protein